MDQYSKQPAGCITIKIIDNKLPQGPVYKFFVPTKVTLTELRDEIYDRKKDLWDKSLYYRDSNNDCIRLIQNGDLDCALNRRPGFLPATDKSISHDKALSYLCVYVG
ncbi:hypothetical protein BDC45DRAFT_538504 [Circinella umbellata]|nr:hypothetical protein BDC45DRAFT_538504 [Circinella umbellata]